MRKITFGGANSLDNIIARPDHAVDWLLWGDEAAALMAAYWKNIDTILMGRKTYEVALRMGSGGDGYGGMKTYVFSRTLPEVAAKGATLVRTDAAAFVSDLKQQEGKDICLMGGGELARSLFEAGLIDELGFNIELQECRPFKNGCVYVSYRVKN
jgi:dihydrofolate reductase